MSQISQLSKTAIYLCLSHCHCCCHSSASIPPTTSPVPQQPYHVVCHVILWLVGVVPFSTNRNVFSCLQTLGLADTFVTKASFYRFFLHQTHSKHDGNVRVKAWRILFIASPVLDMPAHPSSQEVGRVGGLAASYTWTSTDSDSSLLSLCIQFSSDPNGLLVS